MSRVHGLISGVLLGLVVGAAAACGPAGSDAGPDGGLATDASIQNFSDANSSDAAPPPETAEVFAHSSTTLYRLDPNTLEVTTVGDFSGCSNVVDIAVDKDSNLFATTFTALYSVDIQTAACTEIATGNYPNSLSFVPAGVLDPRAKCWSPTAARNTYASTWPPARSATSVR